MPLGTDVKSAIKRSTTWGTAVSPGAGNLLIIDSEAIKSGEEAIKDVGLNGSIYGTPGPLLGSKTVGGQLTVGSRFATNIDLLWALALGSAGSATSIGSGAYTHKIDFADANTEQFTLWMDTNVSTRRVDSAMVNQISFTANTSQRWPFQVEILGRDEDYDSGVSLSSVTEPESTTGQNSFWNLNKSTFQINAASGAALSDINTLKLAEFSLTLNNGLSKDFNSRGTGEDCQDGVISKPVRDGEVSITGSFTIPQYETNAWRAAYSAGTEYKMTLEFCGPMIPGGSEHYSAKFSFPRVRIAEMPESAVTGPARITNKVMFTAYEADTAPAGMTAITKPFSILYTNARSTNLLS